MDNPLSSFYSKLSLLHCLRDVGTEGVPSFEDTHQLTQMSKEGYAFYLQLLTKCRRLRLRHDERPVIPQYPRAEHNTFPFALMRVAAFQSDRLREIEDWCPQSHNPQKQFGSLVRHLFSQYPVPEFMDSVWFRNDDFWIPWFIEVGKGKNIRKVEGFPLDYSKRMAHLMFQAPSALSIEQAIRWGQISALGGNKRFFQEIEHTRIPPILPIQEIRPERHSFWQTVLEWFLRNPMLDPANFGPIVDFIEYQKFSPPRANPEFEITGRSPQALLGLVYEWHGDLGKARRRKRISWPYQGLDWRWEEKRNDIVLHTWEIREILDSDELTCEGKQMHHCVYTYADSCAKGCSVILSLRFDGKRLLTVEYLPGMQKIGQIRGHNNRLPTRNELNFLSRWAQEKGLHSS